jgi:hypothetical protein
MEKSTNHPYLGDLAKTDTLHKLVQTPPEQRNDLWADLFLDNLAGASFQCGDPQVITGPDGYPYFQLFLPKPGVEFQCFAIENMTSAFLLENGIGVVVNPSATGADWVLTYGNIVNYHLHKSFYTTEHSFATERHNEVLTEDEQVMVGQPSEELLPGHTRAILREYLKANGVATPKILLMMRTINGEPIQDIVFNITQSDFENEEHYKGMMTSLRWFLPQHYSYVGMDERTFGEAFADL